MTREDVIAAFACKPVSLNVGGLALHLKPWDAASLTAFGVWRKANPGPSGLYAMLAALSICDAAGAMVFDAGNPADLARLETLDGQALQKIGVRVIDLNGLGDDSPKA